MMAWGAGLQLTDRMYEVSGLLESLYPGLATAPSRRYADFQAAFKERLPKPPSMLSSSSPVLYSLLGV